MKPPLPIDEAERLESLHQLNILDTEPEATLDELTRLAAEICEAPIALISLTDANRQWFKSRVGMTATEIPRYNAFCAHAILGRDLCVVNDTLKDERFVLHPLVVNEPHVRFYAGAPLINAQGFALGTLCVINQKPVELSITQANALRALSHQVVAQLELRRQKGMVSNILSERDRVQNALLESEKLYQGVLDSLTAHIAVLDKNGVIIAVNEAWKRFAIENGGEATLQCTGQGANYLDVCHQSDDRLNEEARPALEGVMAVLDGVQTHFTLEYSCDSPTENRWFLMSVTPLLSERGGVVVAHNNISKRKRAEESLSNSERKYRLLLEKATDGIHTYDYEGNFVDVNTRFCEMLGYTREEMLRLNVKDLIPAEDLAAAPLRLEELRAGKMLLTERRLRRKDGTLFPVEISGGSSGVADEAMLQAIVRDISARKSMEEALRKSEEKLSLHVKQTPLGVIEWNHKFEVTEWNPAAEKIFGYSKDEALGRDALSLLVTEDVREYVKIVWHELLTDKTSTRNINENHTKDGRIILCDWNNTPLVDSNGDVIGVASLVQDVTARKRAEEALRESEARFRQLAENINEVFWLNDWPNNGVVYISPNYEQLWGRTCTSLLTSPGSWIEAVHPDDRAHVVEAVKTKQVLGTYDEEYRITCSDGSVRWIHDRAFPIKNQFGEIHRIAGVATDITGRKQTQEALRASEERFLKAFNANPMPMSINRLEDEVYLYVNASFLRATGYSREEVIGVNTYQLGILANPGDSARLTRLLRENGKIDQVEVDIRRKTGDVRTGLLSAEIVEIRGQHCVISSTTDITESKLTQRRLAAQYAVTAVLADAETLNEATPRILRVICESLGWVIGALWYVNRAQGVLSCVEMWHAPGVEYAEFKSVSRSAAYAPGTGFPSHVWERAEPLWVTDLATDERFPRAPIAAREGLHGGFGFPILLGSEIVGVMEFFSAEVQPPDRDLLDMIASFGSQIGQFMVRKRAEEALRVANDELEARVYERTAELARTNKILQAEIAEREQSEIARVELLRRLVTAQEDERRRIARELHDQTGQHLTAIMLGLKSLRDAAPSRSPTLDKLQRLQTFAEQLSKDVHRLAWELRPAELDVMGLITALQNYLEVWSKHSSTAVDFHGRGFENERLSPEIETVVYRIVQEALTNVLKHAEAQRVGLILERRHDHVLLIVEDDGKGFSLKRVMGLPVVERKMGLSGMKERAALVGGTLEIESTAGAGTTLFVRIPTQLRNSRGELHE